MSKPDTPAVDQPYSSAMPFKSETGPHGWDKSVGPLDAVAIVLTALLAVVTLWVASYPIVDSSAWIFGGMAWSVVAITWAVSVVATATTRESRALALILLIGAVASIPFAGISLLLVSAFGRIGLAGAVVLGLAILAGVVVLSTPRRVAWLVAPTIVLIMCAVLVVGVPRVARLALAESDLTSFAQSVQGDGTSLPAYFDAGISVGSIPIYAVYTASGGLLFVTGYVGMLDDDEAGLAYFPHGAPTDDGAQYDHLYGNWYRWYSCCSD